VETCEKLSGIWNNLWQSESHRLRSTSDLSEALDKLGQREQGLAILQKAIQEDPFNPLLQRSLIFRPHRSQAIRECASSHEPLLRNLSTRLLHAEEIRRRNGGYLYEMTNSDSLLTRRW